MVHQAGLYVTIEIKARPGIACFADYSELYIMFGTSHFGHYRGVVLYWCIENLCPYLECLLRNSPPPPKKKYTQAPRPLVLTPGSIMYYPVEFKGHGNSFHGEGGRGNKVAQLRQCLRLLLSMCGSGDDAIIQDLHEQGAIPMLLSESVKIIDFLQNLSVSVL